MSQENVPTNFLANVDISKPLKEKKNYSEITTFALNIVRAMFDISEDNGLYIDVPIDEYGEILIDRENYLGVYSE